MHNPEDLPMAAVAPARPLRLSRIAPNPAGAFSDLYAVVDSDRKDVRDLVGAGPLSALIAPSGARTLRLFHFNDLHHALQATGPDREPVPLFSRIVGLYRGARAAAPENEIVLLLSGGDDHTGTPLDELLGWSGDELLIDPAYAAYSAAGVDAAAIGNHDLDRGSDVLATGIRKSADFPLLSANLRGATSLREGRDYFGGAIALARGLRIGLIGLITPVDTRAATPADPALDVGSPLAALRDLLPALADATDIVIVMSHCGYGLDDREAARASGLDFLAEGDVAIARLAASLTSRPVVVMGAHSHTLLNADAAGPPALVDGVPIIQAGAHGSHLGEFLATIEPASTRDRWTFSARVHALRSDTQPDAHENAPVPAPDAEFERNVVAPLVARVAGRMNEVLARNDGGAVLADGEVLRERYTGECALMNFVTDALLLRSRDFAQGAADLAILNATALAAGLRDAEDITFGDAYRMMPFADCLQLCTIRGSELLAILRNNAARIVRPEDAGAVDVRANVARGFLHFSGELRYELRLGSSAAGATISNATWRGVALEALIDQAFRVVITNFLGAGGYREAWDGSPIGAGVAGSIRGPDLRLLPKIDTGLVFRNEVIAHMRAVGRVGPETGARRDQRLTVC